MPLRGSACGIGGSVDVKKALFILLFLKNGKDANNGRNRKNRSPLIISRPMTSPLRSTLLTLGLLVVLVATFTCFAGPGQEVPKTGFTGYDEKADGAQQITDALAAAKAGNKRVLLQFGANWCGWCRKLHALYRDDAAVSAELKAHYVVVFVDVNKGHNKAVDDRYGNPSYLGLPALVVLDADGKPLKTQDSTELEEGGGHSQKKVLAFLKTWGPETGK
jgi:thiol:disulfide interchange protein